MKAFENPKYSANRSFIDFMFILVCCLTLFFVITLLQIIKKNEGIQHKAEFILTMTWDEEDLNDMDLWLKDPRGEIIYYKDPQRPSMFLDRDDLGHKNDEIVINGQKQIIQINQEIVSIRAIIPGKWTIAVLFYKRWDGKPGKIIPVTVRLDKLNPQVQIVFTKDVLMRHTWHEVTIATFEMLPDGTVTNLNLEVNEPIVHERIPVTPWGNIDTNNDGEPDLQPLTREEAAGTPGGDNWSREEEDPRLGGT